MDSRDQTYTIKCQSCNEEIALTPFNLASLPYGIIFLAGAKDGYIGITCPNEACLRTTVRKEDMATFQAVKKELVQVGSPGLESLPMLLRHRSFPFLTIPIGAFEIESWEFPFCYGVPHDLNSDKSLDDFEVWNPPSEELTGEIENLYCCYSPNDLAIGPVLTPVMYREEDIHNGVKFENKTRLRAFPRYVIHSPILESIDEFCHRHFITKLKWEAALQFGKILTEGWEEDLEELNPAERREILYRYGSEKPGVKIQISRTYKMQQDLRRNYEFLEILTTSRDEMDRSMECWSPEGETTYSGYGRAKGMEQEVITDYGKGLGKDFLERNCLTFIQEYIKISTKVDFSLDKVESLKTGFLEPLHSSMQNEILATKQYAIYEEPPTWTIIFDGKPTRGLKSKGFKYIHYLLGHTGQEISAADLDPAEDQSWQPIADMKFIEDLKKRRSELKEELEEAERMDDVGRQEKKSQELESIEEHMRTLITPGGSFLKSFKNKADQRKDKIGRSISRAQQELLKTNSKAGAHFAESIKPYRDPLSYRPREPIEWHLK